VIVLEGTWNQARTLLKQLPTTVPRIKLEELPDGKSISHMRKQTMEGRVTTAEAIAYFFKELGESEEAQEALWDNLKLRISRMDAQTNREGGVKGAGTKKKSQTSSETPKEDESL
jgi:DTW domain-containing protein YfiP